MHKEQSSLDIALEDGCTDDFYLSTLELNLQNVLNEFKPDFVFYQSGVDILESDKLGRISLSMTGCQQRDELVFNKTSNLGLPIVTCMGGGYSESVAKIVNAHATTFKMAMNSYY